MHCTRERESDRDTGERERDKENETNARQGEEIRKAMWWYIYIYIYIYYFFFYLKNQNGRSSNCILASVCVYAHSWIRVYIYYSMYLCIYCGINAAEPSLTMTTHKHKEYGSLKLGRALSHILTRFTLTHNGIYNLLYAANTLN